MSVVQRVLFKCTGLNKTVDEYPYKCVSTALAQCHALAVTGPSTLNALSPAIRECLNCRGAGGLHLILPTPYLWSKFDTKGHAKAGRFGCGGLGCLGRSISFG